MIKSGDINRVETRERIRIFGPSIFFVIVAFIIAFQFVDPAPPNHIVIATGAPEGAYFAYGNEYSKLIAKHGVTLSVLETAGSVENLGLLEAPSDGAQIAFVQGGVKSEKKNDHLVSLGSLYFEPLWIFHRASLELRRLTDLKGLRLAAGPEGSGTKALAMTLLELNGITSENSRIFHHGSKKAADLLLSGDIDVALFVTTHRTEYIRKLARSRAVTLMGLERADAYALRYQYLSVLTLPEGTIDLEDNIPAHDLKLIAPTTQLVARSDLHPALIDLILQAATDIHFAGGGFEKEGEFPAPKYLDYELSEEAERFYRSGPPFLQRILPFWVANFLTRMNVMLLPLVALMFPLFKIMPPIYRWRMRSRIYRWYARLASLDPEHHKGEPVARIEKYLSELDKLEEKVTSISVPLSFSDELYQLRLHIDLLRKKLQAASDSDSDQ